MRWWPTRWWPSLTLAAALLASSPLTAAEPASKTFREWVAACDNLGRCVAQSLPAEGASFTAMLLLEREAGASAEPQLSLVLKADALKAPPPIAIMLDGQRFPAQGTPPVTVVDVETAKVAFSPVQTQELVEAPRKANGLKASVAGQTYEASLSGAVAALLWIDEQQGRLETPTALIRKGANPAASIPPARPLPLITAIATAGQPALAPARAKSLTRALRARIGKTGPDCEDTDSLREMDSAATLSRAETLVMLSCIGGAYNYSTGFWIVSDGDAGKARKVPLAKPGSATDNLLVNAEYDPQTGQIAFNAKGRGPGDCGTIGSYAWTGKTFVLTAYEEMPACRGLLPGDHWLVLWRSEVKVAK